MPLPKPALDNRDFDQLVAEGRGLIPRIAPDWTDHNASDPGITLLELFAWLAEQNIYRFDRPSAEALRAFARLVGIEPAAPAVARTVVSIRNANAAPVDLPARIQLASTEGELFETTAPVSVSPAALVEVATSRPFWIDVTANNAALTPFAAFGRRPRRGHAVYFGFDRALDEPDAMLALHFWTDAWRADEATRAALMAEYDAMLDRMAQQCSCELWKAATAESDWHRHYRVHTIWEYSAAGGLWRPLQDVTDETRALSLTGFVQFKAPVDHQPAAPNGLHYVRCRILDGRFECPPNLVHVAFNAVPCEHALTRPERAVAVAPGHPSRVFWLGDAPVAAQSTQVRLDNGAGDVQTDWRECLEWDRIGPHDRAYRLDPERGEIQSGDGLRGEPLPAGYTIRASYRVGGGDAGNIPPKTLIAMPANAVNTSLAPTLGALAVALTVDQPVQAAGGAPAETLRATQARAFAQAARVDKAVTLADIERIALATPGVPVARAHAVAGMHPALPCYTATGVVSVILVPQCALPAPHPSRALLDAVRRYLDPRRLATSELHVMSPCYRRVAVYATLHLGCEVTPEAVEQLALAAIDGFFDPLHGGPDGVGWPIGRTVFRNEIIALLARINGVVRVTALGLRGPGDREPRCDNVELCAHDLVAPGRHRLQLIPLLTPHLTRSDPHECQPC
jgi:predicted phage baseplate assembly protein